MAFQSGGGKWLGYFLLFLFGFCIVSSVLYVLLFPAIK